MTDVTADHQQIGLDYQGNHPDGVRAICKECSTVVLKDTEQEAQKTVTQHNEQRHNGTKVAGVCEWDLQPLLTDKMPLGAKLSILDRLDDDLSHEEKRKVLGLATP